MNTLHPTSYKLLQKLAARLPHAVLLTGAEGSDFEAALDVIRDASDATLLPLDTTNYLSAKETRGLYELASVTPQQKTLIVLDQVHRMSPAAQNALLKLLEEPIEGYVFILVTSQPERLLATVLSRVQQVTLLPITDEQSDSYLNELKVHDQTHRKQLLFIAQGQPRELAKLVTDADYFAEKAKIMRSARSLLQAKAYEKLRITHMYKDSREQATTLLEYSAKLVVQALEQHPSAALTKKLGQLSNALEHIHRNGNVRLTLLSVAV